MTLLISNSTYSQYPQVKKIGNDSVVVITIKQGNDINKQFTVLNDSLKNLKATYNEYMINNVARLQKVYTDWNTELNNHRMTRMEADSFKMMYEANKRIYEFRETEFIKERRSQQIFTAAVMFLAAVLAFL